MKKVNIKTIAEESGVSRSTVSRVLNNSGYVNINTKERILKVIKKYDYVPSNIARNFSTGKSDIIGVIIPEIENPFFGEVLKIISQKTEENGLSIICFNTNNSKERDIRALMNIRNYNVKGLVYTPAIDYQGKEVQKQITSLLDNINAPIVFLDRRMDFYTRADGVYFDNNYAIYKATKTLIEAGHRKIAIINAGLERILARERQEGYLSALKDFSVPYREEYVFLGDYSIEKSYILSKQCLTMLDRPTAVITCNNFTSLGFLKAIAETELVLNKDIICIGVDCLTELEISGIDFNYIKKDTKMMGEKIIDLLFDRFTFPDKPYTEYIVDSELVLHTYELMH